MIRLVQVSGVGQPRKLHLSLVKLLPSAIFPLNRALIYAQTARWTVTELHVSKSPGSNSLAAAAAHKFLEVSRGQGEQMMCPINYQKLAPLTNFLGP